MGLPVYQGADLIAKALDCLQRQTFKNFEAIISVDGNDTETAAACRPFLADSRFTMIVHPKRLDWVGNFNWLLQQDLKEFFCYRQHDDTTAPEFFEALLHVADKECKAAAIYCDCKYSGESNHIEIARSIEGAPLERILEFIERIPRAQGPPIRGLMRSAAIRHAGLVRSDEFRALVQIHGWLAKLLAWGHFCRVGEALYYRLDRPQSLTRHYTSGSEERKRAEWATMFTGLLEAVMPLCHTPDERLFFQQVILTRIVAYPNFGPYADFSSSAPLIAECLRRLKYEGNSRLLTEEELPAVLHGLKDRVDQIGLFDRSRIRRTLYQISQRARLARFLYPRSRMRRANYRVCYLFKVLKRVLLALAFALKIRF